MPRNTGAFAEEEFESFWQAQGKSAHLVRFRDNKDMRGLNHGRALNAFKQPSDYLLACQGQTLFAEVKSTDNPAGFRLAQIAPHQLGSAERVVAAGGRYDFFIRRIHPTAGRWFCVPAHVVLSHSARTLRWADLEPYAFPIPTRLL